MLLSEAINTLAAYCGKRDLCELSQTALVENYGMKQVDVLVLFGGMMVAGADTFAYAMKQQLAKHTVIVGGRGHTTATLGKQMSHFIAEDTTEVCEADMFQAYLKQVHHVQADFLERHSTNCGNNVTNLLALLKEKQIPHQSILIMQDLSMQRRMSEIFQKESPEINIINYAPYTMTVIEEEGELRFAQELSGMWDMERFISLLLGEIVRLRDDLNGYGPLGKGFINHVDIPEDVMCAFEEVSAVYPHLIRQADEKFKS